MLEDLEAHNVAGIRQALWHPVVQPHSIISHWCYCSQLETVKPCKTSQEAVKVWINCKIYDLSLRIFARLEAAHDRIWPVLIIKSLISYVPRWRGVTHFFFRKTSPIAAQKGGTFLDRIRFHSILEGCSDMAISLNFGVDSVGHYPGVKGRSKGMELNEDSNFNISQKVDLAIVCDWPWLLGSIGSGSFLRIGLSRVMLEQQLSMARWWGWYTAAGERQDECWTHVCLLKQLWLWHAVSDECQ